ncbi:MAG: 2-oxoacid:acceptor oxidoreductase family protein [Proteobacteria bacterium]|nr:2-oxoacid:acceptor oxidoreductase family protein [Pseudomonadota bacterium]
MPKLLKKVKLENPQIEIRLSGFGGQGVIMSGFIIGRAAALYEGKQTVLTQSFGPEARGGSCSVQVIISDNRIDYPYVAQPRIQVCMSDEAYRKYGGYLGPHALLLYEEDIVRVNKDEVASWGNRALGIPATRLAEELGKRLVVNIVMVGFFSAVTEYLDPESARKAIQDLVPKGTEELNFKAFEQGYKYGKKMLSRIK